MNVDGPGDLREPGWCARAEAPGLHILTGDRPFPVVRAWPTGMGIGARIEDARPFRLQLSGAGGTLPGLTGRVVRSQGTSSELRLEGLNTPRALHVSRYLRRQIDAGVLHAPSPLLPQSATLDRKDEIVAKLTAFRRHRTDVRVSSFIGTLMLRVLDFDAEAGWVEVDAPPEVLGAVLRCEAVGRFFIHTFEIMPTERTARGVRAPLPTEWHEARSRLMRRAVAPDGVVVRFANPEFPDIRVEGALRDLSHHGLSFFVDATEGLLYPGLQVEEILIEGLDRRPLRLVGELRLNETRANVAAVHLHLGDCPESERRRWHARVGDLLTPNTRIGGTWSEDSWELFERSGYFRLSGKNDAHFAHMKRPFADVSRRLESAHDIGMQIYRTSPRGVEGGISLLRLYSSSIFGYQIARRQDDVPGCPDKFSVLREMSFRAYEQAMAFTDARWLIGFVQASAHWSKFLHYDFPMRYSRLGLADVVDFHAYEIDTSLPIPNAHAGYTVSAATARDLDLLASYLERTRPRAYVEALDYTRDRFTLDRLTTMWRGAGLYRERRVLVACRNHEPVAAAVLESAEHGLHLFGLLDSIRLYPLAAGGSRAFGTLVEAARSWFVSIGRGRCVLLHEGDPFAELDTLVDLGAVHLTMMAMELTPNLLEYVWERTAPKDTRG